MNLNDENDENINVFNLNTPLLAKKKENLALLVKSEPNAKKQIVLTDKTSLNNKSSLGTKVISAESVEFEDFLLEVQAKNSSKSQSEPVPALKTRSRMQTLPSSESSSSSSTGKKEFQINARFLSRLLKHDTLIEEELGPDFDDQLKLFEFLEREGKLSHKVLAVFSKCKAIRSVSMTLSYGTQVNDLGLHSEPAFPIQKCTRSFYSGFSEVQALDFTNVPLLDDELRFLIKLGKLKALGLSGTKITCKSIKYLSTHASFKSNLKCIKLCFVEGLDDAVFSLLTQFPRLEEIDLRGCANLTLKGALQLFPEGQRNVMIRKLSLPEQIHIQLSEKHQFYGELKRAKPKLILDSKDISIPSLDEDDLKEQLKWHKQVYADIYLNMNLDALRGKLVSILRLRKREEQLYSLMVDSV